MSLIKHSLFNVTGFAIPTLIAVPCLGILARWIGVESFGLFTLAFAIVGYTSIFDAGLSRAVIREISIYGNDFEEQKKILATVNILILFLSTLASVLLFFYCDLLVSFLEVSSALHQIAIESFQVLSFIMPFFLFNQIWLGYLEGKEKFININVQRVISSSLIAILPLVFCIEHRNLLFAIYGLLVARIIAMLITFYSCKDILLASGVKFHQATFNRIIQFGGWITVSNVISPLMVYFDRFIVSNILGANKVAYYTAPSEGVTRLVNIPSALSRVLFPKLSSSDNKIERARLEKQAYIILVLVCLPLTVLVILFAKQIMTLWMGIEYGGVSAQVLQILMLGFFFNALAQIPFTVIQSKGLAKTTAIVHMFELLPYLIILYLFSINFGLVGTAWAWTIRVMVDFIILLKLSRF